MKLPPLRRVLFGVVIALGVVALAAIVASALFFQTTAGARWALSWASGSIPAGHLTVRDVRGTLMSPLVLSGVEYRTTSLSVSVDRLAVRWDLSTLLGRELAIRTIAADGVHVRALAASPRAATTGAPALPEIRLPLGLRVGEVRVRDFVYVPPGDSGAFALDEASMRGDFHGDLLHVSALRARNTLFQVDLHGSVRPRREYPLDLDLSGVLRLPGRPEIRGRGRIAGSLERARVKMRLEAPCEASAAAEVIQALGVPRFEGQVDFSRLDPHAWVAGVPRMRLNGRIAAHGSPRCFEASGALSMRSDSLGGADATGAIALLGDSLRVDRLSVTIPGRAEGLIVRGLFVGLGGEPRADLVVDWQKLVWPLKGDTLFRSDRGHLHLAGTPGRYALSLNGGLETAQASLGRWQVEATGDTAHLQVTSLEGSLFGGAVRGAGTLAWRPHMRWTAAIRGDSLDPGRDWPQWPGRLALGIETEGEVRDTVPELEVRIVRLEGSLRHLPLTGTGTLAMKGRSWNASDVRLTWGQARLTADGAPGEEWDLGVALAVPNLEPLLDGASGAVRARMKLSGRRDEPHVTLDARGDSLAMGEALIGAFTLAIDAGLRPGDPLRLVLGARQALLGGFPLDTLALRGEGDLHHHTLSASARGSSDTLTIAASGSFAGERWSGSLDDFELRTRSTGTWRLAAPVAAEAAAHEARFDSVCIRSGDRSVRALMDWHAGESLRAHATLTALPLGLLDRWLPLGANLIGTLDGSIDASAERPEGPLTAQVRLTQSPSQIIYSIAPAQRDTIHMGEGRLTFDTDAQGARGVLAVQWEGGDHLDVQVGLPGFNALRPDTLNQPIEGRIRSLASDLAILGAWVPGLDHTRGELKADLQLAGTMRRPDVAGEVLLRNGRATIPALGVALEDATLTLHCEPGPRTTLEGSIRSGKGSVAITGATEMARPGVPTLKFGVKGKDFSVANTREADVRVSPDLLFELQRSRIDVTGQVDVPFARLVALHGAAQLPVPPSPDVVFLGREVDSTLTGPKVYSRVRVVLGDDVEVRVPRFRGRPEGSILTIDEPGEATRATGELKVREGSYRAYGQDLRIERGRLIFGGGPIANPGLDLRASRTATDGTIAGVQITGTADSPILALFSTPAMSQSDALSYVMFGKPVSETGGSSGAAGLAAAQLSLEGSDVLARGVAGKLGIQNASVESKEGSLQDASLFLGTYLSPKLYVSYGIGLYESQTTIRMRYKMTPHWSIQTESGSEHSGLVQFSGER